MSQDIYGIETRFPVLRSVVREDIAALNDDALAAFVPHAMGGQSAEEIEFNLSGALRSLAPALSKVGKVAAQAAPGALTGAMQGATMGAALGPYGMLAGAALGAVGGGVSSYSASQQARRQAAAAPAAPTPAPRPAQAPRPAAVPRPVQAPSPAPGGSAAVGQLLQILSRPEVLQAILALSTGVLGRQTVQVGQRNVPTTEVLGLVGAALTAQAQAEGWGEAMADDAGLQTLDDMARNPPETHPFYWLMAEQDAATFPQEGTG